LGYEPQPLGSFDTGSVRGYYTDLRAKTRAKSATRPEELQPAALAQLGLGWFERSFLGEPVARAPIDRVAALLRQRATPLGAGAGWAYSVTVSKYGLEPPWYSAMAQAQIASFFVRLYLLGGRGHDAELALAAVDGIRGGVPPLIAATSFGPSLEEAPQTLPSRILNGWIYALWGLWDVRVGLGDAAAGELFDASTRALAALLPEYDLGWWSRYSLVPGRRDQDVAKPFYHRLHVVQLDAMHRLTGLDVFADYSARWSRAATRAHAARSVTGKAAETLRR
jgi:hypothetical protein